MARAPKKTSPSRAVRSRAASAVRKFVSAAKTGGKKKPPPKRRPVAVKKTAPAKPKAAARKPAKIAPKPTPKKTAKAAPKHVAAAKAAAKPGPAKPFPAKPFPAKPFPKASAIAKPPPPPPEPPKPKKPRKPEITPREIEKIRESLTEQRAIFMREFTDIEESTFNVSQSEMSGEVSFDEEYADAGSFTFEREKEMSIGQNIRDLLDKVDHALAAIAKGTYGLCENCGDPINKARLLALPYSTLCIKCKQQEERTR